MVDLLLLVAQHQHHLRKLQIVFLLLRFLLEQASLFQAHFLQLFQLCTLFPILNLFTVTVIGNLFSLLFNLYMFDSLFLYLGVRCSYVSPYPSLSPSLEPHYPQSPSSRIIPSQISALINLTSVVLVSFKVYVLLVYLLQSSSSRLTYFLALAWSNIPLVSFKTY